MFDYELLFEDRHETPPRGGGVCRVCHRRISMRIAQVAPLFESIPPRLYGGTERVISYLTEELVRLGHEVTLFASGDSVTNAKLVPACPRALWRDECCRETLPHHVRLLELVFH